MKMTWKRKLMMRKRKLQFADVVLADQPSKKKINKNLMNHKIVVYVIVYTHVYIYIFFFVSRNQDKESEHVSKPFRTRTRYR